MAKCSSFDALRLYARKYGVYEGKPTQEYAPRVNARLFNVQKCPCVKLAALGATDALSALFGVVAVANIGFRLLQVAVIECLLLEDLHSDTSSAFLLYSDVKWSLFNQSWLTHKRNRFALLSSGLGEYLSDSRSFLTVLLQVGWLN